MTEEEANRIALDILNACVTGMMGESPILRDWRETEELITQAILKAAQKEVQEETVRQ